MHENTIDKCECCGRPIKPGSAVWLELDHRIDGYHNWANVPPSKSQGWFPFGPECAARLLREARVKAQSRGIVVTNIRTTAARGKPKKWRNRFGRIVEVLRADDEGLDGDGMPWLAVCTEHGNLVSVPTKASGIDACRDTTQFCDQCRIDAAAVS